MKKLLALVLVPAAILVSGCAGVEPYVPAIGGLAAFAIAPSGPQTIAPGGTANYTLNITDQGNALQGMVNLSVTGGLPANTTVTFEPNPVAVGGQAAMAVTTSTNTPVGNYTITVTGSNETGSTTAQVQLNLGAAFAVAIQPPTQTISNGDSTIGGSLRAKEPQEDYTANFVQYTVTLTPDPGFVGTVDLTFSGLEGVLVNGQPVFNHSFDTASVPLNGAPVEVILTVTRVLGTNEVGVFELTVTGTSGAIVRQGTAELMLVSDGYGTSFRRRIGR